MITRMVINIPLFQITNLNHEDNQRNGNDIGARIDAVKRLVLELQLGIKLDVLSYVPDYYPRFRAIIDNVTSFQRCLDSLKSEATVNYLTSFQKNLVVMIVFWEDEPFCSWALHAPMLLKFKISINRQYLSRLSVHCTRDQEICASRNIVTIILGSRVK